MKNTNFTENEKIQRKFGQNANYQLKNVKF